MRSANLIAVESDGRRRPSTMADERVESIARTEEAALDFPPLFDEGAGAAPRADAEHAGPTLVDLPRASRLPPAPDDPVRPAGFDTMPADPEVDGGLRPSISFDIFDPALAPSFGSTSVSHELVETADRPRAVSSMRPVAESSTIEFEIRSIVRGRLDATQARDGDARLDPLQDDPIVHAASSLEGTREGLATEGPWNSFELERAVYVGGILVTTTSVNVADLSHLTSGQVQSMGLDRATLGIIQSGVKHVFTPTRVASANVGTVVQNTLNTKTQRVTQIDAKVIRR